MEEAEQRIEGSLEQKHGRSNEEDNERKAVQQHSRVGVEGAQDQKPDNEERVEQKEGVEQGEQRGDAKVAEQGGGGDGGAAGEEAVLEDVADDEEEDGEGEEDEGEVVHAFEAVGLELGQDLEVARLVAVVLLERGGARARLVAVQARARDRVLVRRRLRRRGRRGRRRRRVRRLLRGVHGWAAWRGVRAEDARDAGLRTASRD